MRKSVVEAVAVISAPPHRTLRAFLNREKTLRQSKFNREMKRDERKRKKERERDSESEPERTRVS